VGKLNKLIENPEIPNIFLSLTKDKFIKPGAKE